MTVSNYYVYVNDSYIKRRISKVYHFREDWEMGLKGKPFIYDCDDMPILLEDLKDIGIDYMILKHYRKNNACYR